MDPLEQETKMVLRKLAGMVVISFGIISFLYGAYLFIDYHGGFTYLKEMWGHVAAKLSEIPNTTEFKQYLAVGGAVSFIVAGILLIFWGDKLLKK